MVHLETIHPEIRISPSASTPYVLCNELQLYLLFHIHDESISKAVHTAVHNVGIDRSVYFRFKSFVKYQQGLWNNADMLSHPYADFGLESFKIYEVKQSDWFNAEEAPYQSCKHLLFTFSDSYFEIISSNYEIEHNTEATIKETLASITQKL